ncbi:MAG: hypothetical protein AAF558_08500, partial [Verrucomicrobiota bacterium]
GKSWYGDFFRVSREQNYGRLFEVPDFVPGSSAELTARMALRADVINRSSFCSSQGSPSRN